MTHSIERLRRLAWLLDNSIPIPGTSFRIGLDPILGLIPGLGDAAGAVMSGYIIMEAARLGATQGTLFRMGWNVLVEWVMGLVPLAGDLFDAGWKANQRNLRLIERAVLTPEKAGRADRGFLAAVILTLTAFAVGVVTAGVWLLTWVLSLLG